MKKKIVFAICIFFSSDKSQKLALKIKDKFPKAWEYATPIVCIIVLLICTAYLVDATYNPFLYFRF